MSKAQIYKFMSKSGFIRAASFVGTALLNELREIQQTSPPSTMALGRALTGTTLLASLLKQGQAVALQMNCDGPMKMVFAQASYEGQVRAFIAEPQLPMSVEGQQLVLAPHVGAGTLSVTTYLNHNSQPQRSQVLIESGEITEDIAHYIRTSQQIPCVFSTGISFGPEGVVNAVGGLLVELMPGHTEHDAAFVEDRLQALGSLSQFLAEGASAEELLRQIFGDSEGNYWLHPYEVQVVCSCSLEKVLNSLQLLGEAELEQILNQKEDISTVCQMCGKTYLASQQQIKDIYHQLKKLH